MFTSYLSTKAILASAGIAVASATAFNVFTQHHSAPVLAAATTATTAPLAKPIEAPAPTATVVPPPSPSKPVGKHTVNSAAQPSDAPVVPKASPESQTNDSTITINGWRYSRQGDSDFLFSERLISAFPDEVKLGSEIYVRMGNAHDSVLPPFYVRKDRHHNRNSLPQMSSPLPLPTLPGKGQTADHEHHEWDFDQGRGHATQDTHHYLLPGGSGFSEHHTEHWESHSK